jgi:hypothetical protein
MRGGRSNTDEMLEMLLKESDFHSSFLFLSVIHTQLRSNGVGQIFGADEWKMRFGKILDVVAERHGSRVEMLRRVFAYRERLDDLVNRRGFVNGPDHRFFFALLLNLDNREQTFRLIGERYPDSDPIEKVLDWTYDLSQVRLTGTQNANALGISPFDDFDLQLVEYLLRGRSDSEIAVIIREVYSQEKADQVLPTLADRTAAIRNSVVFAPLMPGL